MLWICSRRPPFSLPSLASMLMSPSTSYAGGAASGYYWGWSASCAVHSWGGTVSGHLVLFPRWCVGPSMCIHMHPYASRLAQATKFSSSASRLMFLTRSLAESAASGEKIWFSSSVLMVMAPYPSSARSAVSGYGFWPRRFLLPPCWEGPFNGYCRWLIPGLCTPAARRPGGCMVLLMVTGPCSHSVEPLP